MSLAFGFALPHWKILSGGFSPAQLFTGGTPGPWFDGSDFSTMFQDRAGTLPVTALEQTVGLWLDKSGNGIIAVAPNDGSRGVVTARVNRLEGTAVLATQTVTVVAATHTLRFSGTGSVTLSGVATGTFSAGVHSVVCTAGSLTVTVTGQVLEADVRPSDQATGLIPTYQRVTTATDYDSTGFPVGVRFDGSDDSYSTAAINYSGTDKVTVFAGVRKNSDAATSAVAELSANSGTNNGTFLVLCDTVARYVTRSRGTSSADLNGTSSFASPITNVVAFVGEISTDTNILRVNGAQNASSTTDQGSGNFGNYPLFIGRRNNTNLPLNGTIYQLIAPGKLCSASEIAATEFYIRQKTKAY